MLRRKHLVRRGMQRGFGLIEALVALAVVTVISMVIIGAVQPWFTLKQSVDNDRRLEDLRQALTSQYDANAFKAEREGATLFGFRTSTIDANGNCMLQMAPFLDLRRLLAEGGAKAASDGYGNPLCVFVSEQRIAQREGVQLVYRNIAVVSPGPDGVLDATTRMANGEMAFGGDDLGFMVSGLDFHHQKLKETIRRLTRVANIYEGYFSTRFLSYADRDITRDYFVTAAGGGFDGAGSVPSTGGQWGWAYNVLGAIGVSQDDSSSGWEPFDETAPIGSATNAIYVGNYNEQVPNGTRVRSPASTGVGMLPYTALLRVELPSGQYLTRVAVGNY